MYLRHALSLALLLTLSLAAPARAEGGVARLKDYHHTIWGAQQGAPGEVSTMTQTRDGWLWLGTSYGLFRFDGVRFEKFAPAAGPGLLGMGISTVWAADNGDLWIGYLMGGMSILHAGRLKHIASATAESPIAATFLMEMDRDGSMWAATTRGLRHYANGVWHSVGAEAGFPGPHADSIFLDHDGRLWVSNERRIYRLDRAIGKFVDSGIDGTVDNMAESADGRLWLGAKTAWRVLPAPATGRTSLPARYARHTGRADGMFDRDGNHWQIRCPAGICRTAAARLRGRAAFDAAGAATDHYDQPWQMGSLAANTMLEDREGNVWIGTMGGLERFRYKKLVAADVPGGESHFQLARDDQGKVWAATQPNAYLFELGGAGAARPDRSHAHLAIGNASDGSLLLVDTTRMERRLAGRSTYTALPAGPDGKAVENNYPLFAFGDAASAWVGIAYRGVYHYHDGVWTDVKAYGVTRKGLSLVAAGADGDAWLAFKGGSIAHILRSGQVAMRQAHGVGNLTMLAAQGSLLAGEEGLAIRHAERYVPLHAADPEALANISGMLVDAAGDRWFNGGKGLLHVRAADWQAVIEEPARRLRYELLDALDGYPGAAPNALDSATAVQGADGTLWFVGTGGIVSIDPAHVRRNTLPPPLVLEGVRTAARFYPAGATPQLPAGTSALQIAYAALSYAVPERLTFEYRLDGVDAQWQAAGSRRDASYTRLGPGDYQFHVRGVNEEGVASVGDSMLAFAILPTFTQTAYFKVLCVFAAAALMYALYAWRLRRLVRYYEERMHVRLAERERIARGLHDTLLQSIQGMLLRFHGISVGLPAGGETRRKMDDVLEQADRAMLQGRHEITALRRTTAHGDDVNGAFAALGAALHDNFGPAFILAVTGVPLPLDAVLGEEVYFIGREALFNAFQHAAPREVRLSIDYGREMLTLTVCDDGAGMDPAVLRAGQRAGHFGLPGMQERARVLGGDMAVHSAVGQGTQLVLRVAAKLLYRPPMPRPWYQRVRDRLRSRPSL